MRPTYVLTACLAVAALALARPAAADVTVKATTTTQARERTMKAETTTYIHGGAMRVETSMEGHVQITILDVDARRFTILNPDAKEAIVTDAVTRAGAGGSPEGASVELTPTGETKEIAGLTCEGYTLKVSMPMPAGQETVTMKMSGPVWASKNAPGAQEYAAFLEKAAAAGLILGDPRAARAQPAQAVGTSDVLEKMGRAGVPCGSDFQMSVSGTGPMAAAMARMGGSEMKIETTSVSTAPVDPALFEIPKGYSVRKQCRARHACRPAEPPTTAHPTCWPRSAAATPSSRRSCARPAPSSTTSGAWTRGSTPTTRCGG